MTTQTKEKIKETIERFKVDSKQLREIIKKWEKELRLNDLSRDCEKCLDAFVELKMSIEQIQDQKKKESFEKKCYEITCNLLGAIEEDWDTDAFLFYYQHKLTASFKQMWDYLHKYVDDLSGKYSWSS